MDLSLENVLVEFGGTKALDALSVEVSSGEMVAVIGSSGAGKSTLFRVLTGSVPATGKVLLGGEDLHSMSHRRLMQVRRGIGTIRQAYDLVPQLPTAMNVALGGIGGMRNLRSVGMILFGPNRELSEAVEAALHEVGLSEKASVRAGELSGGQQQRVAVARLLVQRPEVILADEPFSAVDPVTTERVLGALTKFGADNSATLIVNLHDVELARRFPRVVALKDGRVAYDGPPSGLTDAKLQDIYAGDRVRSRPEPEAQPGFRTPVTRGMDGITAH